MILLINLALAFFIAKDAPQTFKPLIEWAKRRFKLNRFKPFDCEQCFAFWLTLLFTIGDMPFADAIAAAFLMFFIMGEFIEYINSKKNEIDL